MSSIRGAITVEKNDKVSILSATEELLKEIIETNYVDIQNIRSIIFTATKDLTAAYPAVAARKLGITEAGLMCFQEMYVEDSLPMCIRVMVNVNDKINQSSVSHVYLRDAAALRPDINVHKGFAVAVDGPAGTGKSTAAKAIALGLGLIYVDSGAMYRTVGFYCKNNGIECSDEAAVSAALDKIDISVLYKQGKQHIYLNGEDCTNDIRTQEVAMAASCVGKISAVREKLVKMQRRMAESKKIVMDGRDIGTAVFPDAQIKFYLDADVDERAKRRVSELEEKGEKCDFETIKKEIEQRDYEDKNRKISPLAKAEDAIVIDTTNLSAEEVAGTMIKLIKEKLR